MIDEKSLSLKKSFGAIVLLDAIGASNFNEEQIKYFLSTRDNLKSVIKELTERSNEIHISTFPDAGNIPDPAIYTFGDTIVIAIPLDENNTDHAASLIIFFISMIKFFMFNAITEKILFRGVFTIGNYIEDSPSNTLMGEAISDAAAWYELADWIGISSTPRTNTMLEYYLTSNLLNSPSFLVIYPVPLKNGNFLDLYTIPWPEPFFNQDILKEANQINPEKWFLSILKYFYYPYESTMKYNNTKKYFFHLQEKLTAQENNVRA